MFHEWVAAGAAFGISAFVAVITFALCAGVVLGVLAIVARVFGNDNDLQ